ncbi:MAG: hypothetical protein KAJ53_07835 [Anaerolineales bacterium]|nr:hypothetical protein [Anaerolineales bacterium]
MYQIVLAIHNTVRWVILIAGAIAVIRAYMGWFGKRDWTETDRKIGLLFTISIDVQLLLGLLLFIFLSPITKAAFSAFGDVMSDAGLRFFTLEHTFYMLLAVVFAHLGSILPKKVEDVVAKHRRAAIWFTLALLIILLGMPWMRPLFPSF